MFELKTKEIRNGRLVGVDRGLLLNGFACFETRFATKCLMPELEDMGIAREDPVTLFLALTSPRCLCARSSQAMLAFLGFMVQAEATHKGPVQNLLVGVCFG